MTALAKKKIRMIGSISDPLQAKSVEFEGKLAKAALAIRIEAEGKTCGGCSHFKIDFCGKVLSSDGTALEIGGPHAVACREWSAA